MIDVELSRAKSLKKRKPRYGLSIVYILQNEYPVFLILDKLSVYEKYFNWNKPGSYHITFLRCHSTDYEISIKNTDMIGKILEAKKEFKLEGKAVEIGSDGVLRLRMTGLPGNYWERTDVLYLEKLTGLKYSVICDPWITLGYTKETEIKNLTNNYDGLTSALKKINPYSNLIIDRLDIVQYSDTSFNHYKVIESFPLRSK